MQLLRAVWKRLSRLPGLRRLTERPKVDRAIRMLRHSLAVRESLRFLLREAIGGSRVASYRLRGSGMIVVLRHNEHDAWVLHEVFDSPTYEVPRGAQEVLNRGTSPLRVVDVGAHVGFFCLLVLDRYPGAEITAFEPDPSNAGLHEECMRRNGRERQWQLVRACASTEEGSVWFAGGLGERSHITAQRAPGTIELPAVDLFRYLRDVDLLKMDIEGGEWRLLADERLADSLPRVIILEYHSFACPEPDARRAAMTRLADLGYEVEAGTSLTSEVGTLWAWRPTAAPTAPADAAVVSDRGLDAPVRHQRRAGPSRG